MVSVSDMLFEVTADRWPYPGALRERGREVMKLQLPCNLWMAAIAELQHPAEFYTALVAASLLLVTSIRAPTKTFSASFLSAATFL